MFDDLMDIFDRDRSARSPAGTPQRGMRGLLSRLTGDHEPDERSPRPRRDHDDDEDDAFDRDISSRRGRRDAFDLDD
ncbi:MAG: hypothetical protein M3457_07715 [Chloroflexota bacterium]|nr:hypothetical protein [Chloroflexota bacterium]